MHDARPTLPTVAEVILVDAGRVAARRNLVQGDAPMIDRTRLELVVRLGEADVADLELDSPIRLDSAPRLRAREPEALAAV